MKDYIYVVYIMDKKTMEICYVRLFSSKKGAELYANWKLNKDNRKQTMVIGKEPIMTTTEALICYQDEKG